MWIRGFRIDPALDEEETVRRLSALAVQRMGLGAAETANTILRVLSEHVPHQDLQAWDGELAAGPA